MLRDTWKNNVKFQIEKKTGIAESKEGVKEQ
jgi:hypothetical protein